METLKNLQNGLSIFLKECPDCIIESHEGEIWIDIGDKILDEKTQKHLLKDLKWSFREDYWVFFV